MKRAARVAAGIAAAAVALAACGGTSSTTATTRPATEPVASTLPALHTPGCSNAVSLGPALGPERSAFVAVPGDPFGVVTTSDGRWTFVALNGGDVAVMSDASGVPRLMRVIPVGGPLQGEALTRDGRYLLVADRGGAAVLSVARAESGAGRAVLGLLGGAGPAGAIQVAVSPDDRYAFVALEYRRAIDVFDLAVALAGGFHRAGYVGAIPLGIHPVGMTISPHGRSMYAVTEIAGAGAAAPGQGALNVIDLRRAETDPAGAVETTVSAGCDTARVAVSPDGRTVWATARGSNVVLGWSAAKLAGDPAHALIAVVRVGQSPVGLAFADPDRLVVSDSDRFRTPGRTTGLTVLDVGAAEQGRPAVLGTIVAGRFPREMALSPDGRTLLVGNFDSQQVEVVATAEVP